MKNYRRLFSILLCLVLLVSCVGTVSAETGTNDGVSSEMNSDISSETNEDTSAETNDDISSETNDETSAENRTPVNYALGKKYAYSDDVLNNFNSGNEDDSCTLLTDGIVAVPETPFETVVIKGTGRIVTVILDLGATYNNIVSVNFCGVCDTYGDRTLGQNRGFSGEKTMIYFSENNVDFDRNTDFVMTKEETGEESYYNFKFNFNSPITASAVKICMYSPAYILSLSEIQVVGKPIMNDGNLGENVNYSLHDDGTMEIYGNGKMDTSFPLHYLEKNIKNVVIKGEVTLLPSAFEGMKYLESVELQGEFKELPANAFSGCVKLEKVILNNSLEKIGESAFFGCENLKSIIIPDSVESIGDDAFGSCTSLEEATIGQNITSLGKNVFDGTDLYNNAENWVDGVFYVGNYVAGAIISKVPSELVVKDGTKLICNSAFRQFRGLKSVTLPKTLTVVDDYAFQGCSYLEVFNSFASIKKIGNRAFCECGIANEIVLENIQYLGEYAFYCCQSLISVKIGDSLDKIGDYAFKECLSLKSFEIGKNVKEIGKNSFENCYELLAIELPPSVQVIGERAFGTCTQLSEIVIPNGVTRIESSTFICCYGLNSVYIPETVEYIGDYAFSQCSLKTFDIPHCVTVINTGVFINNNFETVEIPYSVTTICDEAFSGCNMIKDVIIPSSVKLIGNEAFLNTYFERVKIPATVEYIGEYAFGFTKRNSVYVYNFDFVVEGFSETLAEEYAGYYGFGFEAITEEIQFTDENITCKNGFVFGLETNLKVNDINNLTENENYSITDSNGVAIFENSSVGTGATITFSNGTSLTVVVKGDTDGNGSVTSTDYIQIKKAFSKSIELVGAFALAADTTGDGEINTTDYIQVKSHFLGTIDMYA